MRVCPTCDGHGHRILLSPDIESLPVRFRGLAGLGFWSDDCSTCDKTGVHPDDREPPPSADPAEWVHHPPKENT